MLPSMAGLFNHQNFIYIPIFIVRIFLWVTTLGLLARAVSLASSSLRGTPIIGCLAQLVILQVVASAEGVALPINVAISLAFTP